MNQIAIMLTEYWAYLCIPLIFVGVIVWVFRPTGKAGFRAAGEIPFEEEDDQAKAKASRGRS